MIRLQLFKQYTKFTYDLWKMRWDDQIRGIQTIDTDHVRSGNRGRKYDGIIRLEVFRQLTKFTYRLEMTKKDDQIKDIQIIDRVHVQSGEVPIGGSD